jgi:tRNA C32,U32 (ribose-2'-O)-methylase TrmJ
MTVKHISVIEGNQESLSEQMMNEIRAAIMRAKYDHMSISTLIGVLEMLKLEQWERTTK